MTALFRIVLVLVSLATFFIIVKKIRNAKVQIEVSLFWIVFAVGLMILSLFPQIVDVIADILGIYSSTNAIFLLVIFILLVHQFLNSLKISQLENRMKDLVQELAVTKLMGQEETEEM